MKQGPTETNSGPSGHEIYREIQPDNEQSSQIQVLV
jgi:hypothetical protein